MIRKSIVTEKAVKNAVPGRYTLEVDIRANKKQIVQAVAEQFGVNVVRVNTLIGKGKTRRLPRSRGITKAGATKKAIVTLKKGQEIKELDVKE